MSFIHLEYRRHMWQVPICIYPSQFPDLSRHKALTSMLHLPLICREQVVALPQVIHMPQFRGSAHEITIPCRAGNTFILRKNTDVQPCPWTHSSLVCFGKWCWLSFWRGVGFLALTGVTAGVAVAGCLLEKGKCEHHVAAALGCFLPRKCRYRISRREGARLKWLIHKALQSVQRF